jgi:hypothetical protein
LLVAAAGCVQPEEPKTPAYGVSVEAIAACAVAEDTPLSAFAPEHAAAASSESAAGGELAAFAAPPAAPQCVNNNCSMVAEVRSWPNGNPGELIYCSTTTCSGSCNYLPPGAPNGAQLACRLMDRPGNDPDHCACENIGDGAA